MSYYTCLSSHSMETALMTAAYRGETKVVVELVKAGGALLDVQDTVGPYPIIHDVRNR